MQHLYVRPAIHTPSSAVSLSTHPGAAARFAGLGDLGDTITPAQGTGGLKNTIRTWLTMAAGATALAGADYDTPGQAVVRLNNVYRQGLAGSLVNTSASPQQATFNAFRQRTELTQANESIWWMFGRLISDNSAALAASLASVPDGDTATYTLMDTSQSGTTWYGGTTVSSKLTNAQWADLFNRAFTTILRGVTNQVLSVNYLQAVVQAMCLTDPVKRRFPVWSPPGGAATTSPEAIAFRSMLRQLGWPSVTQTWFGFTRQAWAQDYAAFTAQDQSYGAVISALNYASGKVVYDQVVAKVNEYMQQRASALRSLADFDALVKGPLGTRVPAADIAAATALRKSIGECDSKVSSVLGPFGLAPGLGGATLILYGVLAVTALGLMTYMVVILTETSRSAAAQTKQTADSILATVDALKASCTRAYLASAKTPADEKTYQDCLATTKDLYATIPAPPDGGDPLGLKNLALLGAVILGFVVIKGMKKGGGGGTPG